MLTYADIDKCDLTPMMRQYMELKEQRPDSLLFFRLGDFYELFFDDAITASKVLDLTLTGRDCGLEDRAPMAGVPYHAAENYLQRLIKAGYKVAIAEQVEDPAEAQGLVRRDVIRVLTPGTVADDKLLDARADHFLVAVYRLDHYFGLAALDLSSGRTEAFDLLQAASSERLLDELLRLAPKELLWTGDWPQYQRLDSLIQRLDMARTVLPQEDFDPASVANPELLHDARPGALWPRAAAAILNYVEATQFCLPKHLEPFSERKREQFMELDSNCRLNLELTESLWDRKRRGSLLWAMDRTQTAMGARVLRRELERPLGDIRAINERLDAVGEWSEQFILRQNLREELGGIIDLERLTAKIALERLNPREILAIAELNEKILNIQELLGELNAPLNQEQAKNLLAYSDLADTINRALVEEPPLLIKDGGLIREGFDAELDELKDLASGGKDRLLKLETEARENSGIKKLKVGYNRIYGYYFEVPKSQTDEVPENFQRRQTLTNSERYVTEELKHLEHEILKAEEEAKEIEYRIFLRLREAIEDRLIMFQKNARALAFTDFLSSLAELAEELDYVRPELTEEPILDIERGRHPVVEQSLKDKSFVPNSLVLNPQKRVMILTGPNMSGKSTYLRQNALITLMAHVGSFVPADRATIGLCDRIFTRIGASDNLVKGQSTFMVEMLELSEILRQATDRSLLVLDEIGRGTSTFDGLAIAWAVVEHLGKDDGLPARALFATHYHELCELPEKQDALFNAHVAAEAHKDELMLLHEIREGPSNDSYGIDVARLAGVPEGIVQRATAILKVLETANKGKRVKIKKDPEVLEGQMDFLSQLDPRDEKAEAVARRLKEVDLNLLRPIEALALLAELKEGLENE